MTFVCQFFETELNKLRRVCTSNKPSIEYVSYHSPTLQQTLCSYTPCIPDVINIINEYANCLQVESNTYGKLIIFNTDDYQIQMQTIKNNPTIIFLNYMRMSILRHAHVRHIDKIPHSNVVKCDSIYEIINGIINAYMLHEHNVTAYVNILGDYVYKKDDMYYRVKNEYYDVYVINNKPLFEEMISVIKIIHDIVNE